MPEIIRMNHPYTLSKIDQQQVIPVHRGIPGISRWIGISRNKIFVWSPLNVMRILYSGSCHAILENKLSALNAEQTLQYI